LPEDTNETNPVANGTDEIDSLFEETVMRSNKRTEKRPPKIWDLPFEIRRQLSGRGGRQRAIAADNHLMVVLYCVPEPESNRGETVYFWRNRDHEWHYSERGGGFSALEKVVQQYEDRVAKLDDALSTAEDSRARFQVLDEITPVLRSVRNLSDTLHKAWELSEHQRATENVGNKAKLKEDEPQQPPLQMVWEHANEITRAAEILKSDAESAIQFAHARQQELQSHYVRQQSQAAHRLNILAATFLPVATISSVFGMNLASGLENTHVLFWLVLVAAVAVGAWIGYSVMNVRQINPTDW